jgi:hypothetical protein
MDNDVQTELTLYAGRARRRLAVLLPDSLVQAIAWTKALGIDPDSMAVKPLLGTARSYAKRGLLLVDSPMWLDAIQESLPTVAALADVLTDETVTISDSRGDVTVETSMGAVTEPLLRMCRLAFTIS